MGMFSSKSHPFGEITATENTEPLKPTGRAGRNLPAAITVGVVLFVLVVGTMIFSRQAFMVLVIVALCVAQYELARAFKRGDIDLTLPPLWLGTIGMGVCAWTLGAEALLAALAVTVMAVVIWRVSDGWSHKAFKDVFVSGFTLCYVGLMGSFAILLTAQTDNPGPLIIWLVATIANDLGGYITGVLFGKHPMAPSVSPSKSWEGFAGSAALCMVTVSVGLYIIDYPWWAGVIQGFVTAIVATLGDLGESVIKRDVGLKDMGHLIPGHGGIMDRLDSLLVTAPLFYFFFTRVLTV